MITRVPALLRRGAGLADGSKTAAPSAGSLPRGGITCEAQSEREKRDPRHSDDGAASSSRPPGGSRPTRRANATARLRPARSWRYGDRPWTPSGGRGWSSYAFAQALTIQQLPIRTSSVEAAKMKFETAREAKPQADRTAA